MMRKSCFALLLLWLLAWLLIVGAYTAHAAPCNAYDGSVWAERCHITAAPRYISVASGKGVGPRPARWCGWWMRTQFGGGPEYNLAWNWRKRGVAGSPQVGAVVVWRNHVGVIVGRTEKGWVVKSGNDGGAVRSRVRSIKGAVIRVGV